MPIRSLTADRIRCTPPKEHRSSAPNVAQEKLDLFQFHSRGMRSPSTGPPQIVRRQLANPMLLADSFTMCQTAISVIRSPQVLPTLLTHWNSLPRSMAVAVRPIVKLSRYVAAHPRWNESVLTVYLGNSSGFWIVVEGAGSRFLADAVQFRKQVKEIHDTASGRCSYIEDRT
jgi:hypothetical protein